MFPSLVAYSVLTIAQDKITNQVELRDFLVEVEESEMDETIIYQVRRTITWFYDEQKCV